MVTTDTGTGRWLRELLPAPKWTLQTTWGVDEVAGNDENSGLDVPGSRLKTLSEVARRLRVIDYNPYTINVTGNIGPTDLFEFNPSLSSSGLSTVGVAEVFVNGSRVTVLSGLTVDAATISVPATNSQASITDAAVTWATHIGRLLVVTSGAQSGAIAWVLKDNGGSAARLSNWYFPITNTFAAAAPAPGDTYDIVTLAQFDSIYPTNLLPGVFIRFSNFEFTSSAGGAAISNPLIRNAQGDLTTCKLTKPGANGLTLPFSTLNVRFALNGCLTHFSVLGQVANFGTTVSYNGCAFINAHIKSSLYGRAQIINCALQACSVECGQGGVGDTSQQNGQVAVQAGAFGLGIFDSPISAVRIQRAGVITIDAPLYGSGNTRFGSEITEAGALLIRDAIIPTITGTLGEVQLEARTTHLQSLLEMAPGPLAALVSLATWADWNAAVVVGVSGFGRKVLGFEQASKIITVAAPVF